MAEPIMENPELPPPGRRSGAGSESILPFLLQSLAARPAVPAAAPARSRPGRTAPARRAPTSRSS